MEAARSPHSRDFMMKCTELKLPNSLSRGTGHIFPSRPATGTLLHSERPGRSWRGKQCMKNKTKTRVMATKMA